MLCGVVIRRPVRRILPLPLHRPPNGLWLSSDLLQLYSWYKAGKEKWKDQAKERRRKVPGTSYCRPVQLAAISCTLPCSGILWAARRQIPQGARWEGWQNCSLLLSVVPPLPTPLQGLPSSCAFFKTLY